MILERGRVVRRSGRHVFVRSQGQRYCARCASGYGCGGSLQSRLLGRRLFEVRALVGRNPLSIGDEVVIGLPDTALLKAAALVYLLPVLLLAAGAWLGSYDSEATSILGAGVGLFGGFFIVHRLRHYLAASPGLQPVIVQRNGRSLFTG